MFTDPISNLTVYGDDMSGNCLKVKWVAERCGLSYDWVAVDVVGHECRNDPFLALNPVGQVPVVRWPDGRILTQSNAIILYFAETTESDLIPRDAFQYAQMQSWLFWEQYSHEPTIAVRRFLKHFKGLPDTDIDPTLMEKGIKALSILEMQTSYTEWLVGDALSLADIALVAYTRIAHEGGFDLADFPAVARWVARVEKALGLPSSREAA
ncbi:MAG: glutathione S-transferase family protein [Pseudomonadota bacterium]